MVEGENIMDNYIVINGKKVELTEEQLKQLGINAEEKKETPFARHSNYWSISASGSVEGLYDYNSDFDNAIYDNVNYFNDYKFAQQVDLHQLLYRKLLKYAYENDAFADDWSDLNSVKYLISKHTRSNKIVVDFTYQLKHSNVVYFTNNEVAEQAIEDVILPFMVKHPEFVW